MWRNVSSVQKEIVRAVKYQNDHIYSQDEKVRGAN